ncbi:MAG: 16S rRNA (cytosine(967)-C(5))-methyltransferase RsmB [Deltaproteobacteria bacterium]|nr:16S rRNA (cytosine(967)-C(5))-methyltransferase RsmB [Deltaproteobacteria bacterium]
MSLSTTTDRPASGPANTAREVARRVLDRVDKGGAWATLALDAELERSGLPERDRRLASELVYGVLRHRTRIDRALSAHADLKKSPPKIRTTLRVAVYQLLFLDRVPAYAAVDDAVEAARAIGDKLAGFTNAVLRKLTRQNEPPFPALAADASLDAQLARIEQEHSMPRWILDELTAAVRGVTDEQGLATPAARAARVAELAIALNEQPPLIARVNLRKITRDALASELASRARLTFDDDDSEMPTTTASSTSDLGSGPPLTAGLSMRDVDSPSASSSSNEVDSTLALTADSLPPAVVPAAEPSSVPPGSSGRTSRGVTATPLAMTPSALRLDGIGDPSRDPAFAAGRWTVQDAGAQLVGQFAAPRAGTLILDACAGVGGKSTHLAELVDDAATIHAADQSATKLGLLAETAQRLGLTCIDTYACDLTDPAAPLGRAYDLIVIDAPCSGLGVLRRHPDAKWRLTPDTVPRLATLQAQLLDAVAARLAPGGTLVYAVCTFTRAEGPDQIAAFCARSGFRVLEEARTWPPEADAFYFAKLARP